MQTMRSNLTLVAAFTFEMMTAGNFAYAGTEAPEEKPDNEWRANTAAVSDYRYRGISQTRLKPALQGGADDVNNPTGLYVGTWLSTIKWIRDAGGDAGVEWDLYAGKRGAITRQLGYDVGGLAYAYPSNGLRPGADTFELYGQLSLGPVYLKYSQSTANLFGVADSRYSSYVDAGGNVGLGGGYTLSLHVGRQDVRHYDALSYSDYKVGLGKDFGPVALSLAAFFADTDGYLGPVGEARNLGRISVVLTVSKTF